MKHLVQSKYHCFHSKFKFKSNDIWLGHIRDKLENFLTTFQSLHRTKPTLDYSMVKGYTLLQLQVKTEIKIKIST